MVFIILVSSILVVDFCLKFWYHGGNRVRLPAASRTGVVAVAVEGGRYFLLAHDAVDAGAEFFKRIALVD
nr:MAG TPA: hypothetical protein [Siphoviridae sp. ctKRf14]